MKMHSPIDNIYPDAQKEFTSFRSKYSQALSNHVVKHFLDQQSNYRLFTTAICFPTEENWRRLDETFRQFYIEIRFTHYIAKVLWRYARDFRSKRQRDEAHYLFILDQPIQDEQESSSVTYKDRIISCNEIDFRRGGSLLDQVECFKLQEALKQLTDKQLNVLNNYYVYFMTQKEIAYYLGVSQQSVSKTMETALDRIKDFMKEKHL